MACICQPPQPADPTKDLRADEVLVIFGDSASIANHFPQAVLQVNDDEIFSVKRDHKGDMALEVKGIASDGEIVFRVDENGVITGSDVHLLRPDKSTVLIEAASGSLLLRARYLNKQVFKVEGKIPYRGKTIPIQLQDSQDNCLRNFHIRLNADGNGIILAPG